MKAIFQYIKGDRLIWAIVTLLAISSFLPVYSASSNLVNLNSSSDAISFFFGHLFHMLFGFAIIIGVHQVPYRYFKGLSFIFLPAVLVLLIVTIAQGTNIEGANASRWIQIPLVGMSFQTSTFASVVLMVYVARYLAKYQDKEIRFLDSVLGLWLPVFLVLILILPANFSTAAIIFSMVLVLSFVGGYPVKYLGLILASGIVALTFFVLIATAFPDVMPNRVDTWMSRVSNFSNGEDTEADYQIEKAKIAIATGGIVGVGPGKSVQKNFLPQSSSDFIYAIIVEEYGILGGLVLIILYSWFLLRIIIVAQKADTIFGRLVVLGVGLPIVFQAFINMAVAVELFPVTGQPLPLISKGGTSVWMTCLAIGIILSVSAKREEIIKRSTSLDDEEEQSPLEILSETL